MTLSYEIDRLSFRMLVLAFGLAMVMASTMTITVMQLMKIEKLLTEILEVLQ